jgi:hypothetical protein
MRLLAVLCAVLAMTLMATTASAATKTKTVDAEIVFEKGNRPGDPGNCSSVVFGKWKDVPGTTAATVYYTWRGTEYSVSGEPPWNDTYEWVATYTVEPGYHWLEISTSWSDGPRPNDCSSQVETAKERYSTEGRAELTIEIDPAKCKAAEKAVTKWRGKVTSIKAQLRKAETKRAKRQLNAKLTAAKEKRGRAVKRAGDLC